jgi:hypothetical protein
MSMEENKLAQSTADDAERKTLSLVIREQRELLRVAEDSFARVQKERRELVKLLVTMIDNCIRSQRTTQSVCSHYWGIFSKLSRYVGIKRIMHEQRKTRADATMIADAVAQGQTSARNELLKSMTPESAQRALEAIDPALAHAQRMNAIVNRGKAASHEFTWQLNYVREFLLQMGCEESEG